MALRLPNIRKGCSRNRSNGVTRGKLGGQTKRPLVRRYLRKKVTGCHSRLNIVRSGKNKHKKKANPKKLE